MKKVLLIFSLIVALLCGCTASNQPTEDPLSSTENATAIEKKSIPQEYFCLLQDYLEIIYFRLSASFEKEYNNGFFPDISDTLENQLYNNSKESVLPNHWWCMIADMLDNINNPTVSSFGYVLKDLNGDDSPELLWTSANCEKVFAIFTIDQGKAVLLDAYWQKHKAIVLETGEIWTMSIGGTNIFEYKCCLLDQRNSTSLNITLCFGYEKEDYFEEKNTNRFLISKEKFNVLKSESPFNTQERKKVVYLCPHDVLAVCGDRGTVLLSPDSQSD